MGVGKYFLLLLSVFLFLTAYPIEAGARQQCQLNFTRTYPPSFYLVYDE